MSHFFKSLRSKLPKPLGVGDDQGQGWTAPLGAKATPVP